MIFQCSSGRSNVTWNAWILNDLSSKDRCAQILSGFVTLTTHLPSGVLLAKVMRCSAANQARLENQYEKRSKLKVVWYKLVLVVCVISNLPIRKSKSNCFLKRITSAINLKLYSPIYLLHSLKFSSRAHFVCGSGNRRVSPAVIKRLLNRVHSNICRFSQDTCYSFYKTKQFGSSETAHF